MFSRAHEVETAICALSSSIPASRSIRIVRIERHVGAARLEDPKQRHDHLEATLETNRDAFIGLDVEAQQMAGELIASDVEFGIGEALVSARDRDRAGRLRRLRLKKLVHAFFGADSPPPLRSTQ